MNKRKTLVYYSWDEKASVIQTAKGNWWFTKRQEQSRPNKNISHCAWNCKNDADVVYISDKGYASIAYCDGHAESRILECLMRGEIERGIWCIPAEHIFVPHHMYENYMKQFEKMYPKQAKKLHEKLNAFMRTQHLRQISKKLYYDYR